MNSLPHKIHPARIIAFLTVLVVVLAAGIGLLMIFGSDAGSAQYKTLIMHDGDTLNRIVNVPKGTYLVVKSDQNDLYADVKVTENGGFKVKDGGVLVLENVNFSGSGNDRTTPVFSVAGKMIMKDGAVENFTASSSGSSLRYGSGGASAICLLNGDFTMNGGTISGNSSTTTKTTAFGGAIRAEGKDASVTINNGTVSGNMVLSSAEVPDNSTITANALGGAVAVTEGASVTVNGGNISGNTAGSHAANAKGSDSSVCTGDGGAIAVYSSDRDAISSVCIDGGSIVGNNAYRTGADDGAAATATSETHGGGIFSNAYTKAVMKSGKIAGNTSDDKGGGVFLDSKKSCGGAVFKNTLVSGNEAKSLGGGLWFCPDGSADMYSTVKADGIAVFNNTTTERGTDGAGDDLYVSPRSGDTGVTITSTMLGGGSNAWYQDGGASTQKTSSGSSRYTSSASKETSTLLTASAVTNKPTAAAEETAVKTASLVITDNSATYGGGVGSNNYLSFGTPTSDDSASQSASSDSSDSDSDSDTSSEQISISVNKVWYGDEGSSATVHLFADGTETASATLTADSSWSYTFTGLDKYDSSGNEINYTLTEDAIDGYTSKVTGSASSGFTVTNIENVTVAVELIWSQGLEDSATVQLYSDGVAGETMTLSASNDWNDSFTAVPKYDEDGDLIVYSVQEINLSPFYEYEVHPTDSSGLENVETLDVYNFQVVNSYASSG
jgi:hypothetical protein